MDPLAINYSAEKILQLIRTQKDAFWARERERRPLALFHAAALRVPAYKDFLKKHKVNPAKVKTFKDFEQVPPISKKNYLRQYPLEKLCWDGTLKKPLVFTSTSGSTGEPFYFPRGAQLDWEYSVLAELFLASTSKKNTGSTLVIVGLGMGAWIGGLITYKAFELASQRGKYPISIITPGINKAEIFHALRQLSPHYQQTILVGYPPFVKDIIDEANSIEKLNLKKINLRIMTAAEAFTEKFRDYLVNKTDIKNLYLDTLNIYGTADIGAMAYETPSAILIRRLTLKDKQLFQNVFSPISKTPTLAQYNPLFITFEAVNGDIMLSGFNTIPLVRYAIGDHGGVFNFQHVAQKFKQSGIDLVAEAKKVGIANNLYELPYVYVYERSDFSTKLYGAIIYPEHIREGISHPKLEDMVTGKFTMLTQFDKDHNEFLEIHFELKPNNKPSNKLKKLLEDIVIESLLQKNAEYRNNYSSMPHRVRPRIILWNYEHPLHFKRGIKQKWVKK